MHGHFSNQQAYISSKSERKKLCKFVSRLYVMCRRVCRGGGRRTPPPRPPKMKKSRKKPEIKIKSKKIGQHYHNAVYKWIKVMSFRGGNPPSHPNFVEVRTSPKLILHTPLVMWQPRLLISRRFSLTPQFIAQTETTCVLYQNLHNRPTQCTRKVRVFGSEQAPERLVMKTHANIYVGLYITSFSKTKFSWLNWVHSFHIIGLCLITAT